MKQILKSKDLVGKTIAQVLETDYNEMWIKFDDDSFVVIEPKTINDQGFSSQETIGIDEYEHDADSHELLELGIISEKEYQHAKHLEKLATKIKQEEYEKERERQMRQVELEQYKKLKTKYEDKY